MKQLDKLIVALYRKLGRYRPQIVWSTNSVTHNVFRFFELIFGREYGIRREMIASYNPLTKKTYYAVYTIEAMCALLETEIRNYFKGFKIPEFEFVTSPVFAGVNMPVFPTGYLFAIARDASTDKAGPGTVSSISWTHTCTGSNLTLFAWTGVEGSGTVDAGTYAGNNMTFDVRALQYSGTHRMEIWHKIAPTTGANTVAFTYSASKYSEGGFSVSYTGTNQSSQPDATAEVSEATGNTASTTITTTQSNCWVFGVARLDNAGTYSVGGVLTMLDSSVGDTGNMAADSNGTVPSGSNSVSFSSTNNDGPTCVVVAVAPAASGPTTVKTWDGVTQSTGIKTYKDVTVANVKTVDGAT